MCMWRWTFYHFSCTQKATALISATMGKTRKNFYAVRVGRNTGVYNSWEECEAQVKRYPGAVYKGFQNNQEASSFASGGGGSSYNTSSSNYGRKSNSSRVGCATGYAGHSYSSNARERYSGDFSCNSRTSVPSYSVPSYGGRRNYSSLGGSSSSSHEEHRNVVYSDGCCTNNGFHGAKAGVGVYWGDGSAYNVSEKLEGHPTNQRAELVGACRALETAIEQGYKSVEVKTDSSYTIKAMTEWVRKWKHNGWRTSNCEDVKNKGDIKRLDGLCQKIDVKWTHVPGHKGVPGNEAADTLAKAGSRK